MAGPPLRPLRPTHDEDGDAEGWARLAGGEEDRDRDCSLPLCRGDAGARLYRRIGDWALLTAGTGASAGHGAPVDDLGILVCTQLSFTSAR